MRKLENVIKINNISNTLTHQTHGAQCRDNHLSTFHPICSPYLHVPSYPRTEHQGTYYLEPASSRMTNPWKLWMSALFTNIIHRRIHTYKYPKLLIKSNIINYHKSFINQFTLTTYDDYEYSIIDTKWLRYIKN